MPSTQPTTSQDDTQIATQRLEIIRDFELLELNQSVLDLAEQFLERSSLPAKADVDAVHIAASTVHGMDYLLTWNCKHIANAQIQRKLAEISLDSGYELPILCTPYELLGDELCIEMQLWKKFTEFVKSIHDHSTIT